MRSQIIESLPQNQTDANKQNLSVPSTDALLLHTHTHTLICSHNTTHTCPKSIHKCTHTQAGTSICRVIPALTRSGTRVTDVFETVRPHMDLTVNNILAHINTVFVLRTKVDKYSSSSSGSSGAFGFGGTKSGSLLSSGMSGGAKESSISSIGGGSEDQVRRPPSPSSEHSK